MSTDPLEPLIPPHPEVVAYQAEVDAALRGNPERAARLAALEAECGRAETAEAFRAGSMKIRELLEEVWDEVDAVRRVAGRPVPKRGGYPGPT
jgi:hypothetical protein